MSEGGAVVGATKSDGAPSSSTKKNEVAELAMAMWQSGGSGLSPDIVKHVNSEHIDKALDHADAAHSRISDDRKDTRKYHYLLFVTACATFLFVVGVLVWTGNSELLGEHFNAVVGLLAGAFGGYGIGKGRG